MKNTFSNLTTVLIALSFLAYPSLLMAAPSLPARIGGSVTAGSTSLSQGTDTGYAIFVTKHDGTPYVPSAVDSDGLNSYGWYVLDIPIHNDDQPGGAQPGSSAQVHVSVNGKEATVISPPDGMITVGKSGSVSLLNLQTKVCSIFFEDVPVGNWAEDYISTSACEGISSGYGDGTYRPKDLVNRAQIAVYIVRAVDGSEPADCVSGPFPDVPAGFWACKYIKRAVDLGIVSGFPDGTYKPTQIVNRAQMAAFIIKGMIADGQLGGEPSDCVSDPFPDVPSGHIFCTYINELVNQGIASGFGDGTYKPTRQVNRAQISVFIGRAFLGMK